MNANLKAELEAELKESKDLLSSYDLDGPGPEDRTPSEEAEYQFHWRRVNELEQELLLFEKEDNIPNCTLWEATTETGGVLQALVPFGEDEGPYLAAATDDLDVVEVEWEQKGEVYSLTIRELLKTRKVTKKVTMTDNDEWNFESEPFSSLVIDGRGVLDGYATVRAINEDGVVALFQCPGKGISPYCFGRADDAARAAGFTPIGNFYQRKVRGQPWLQG